MSEDMASKWLISQNKYSDAKDQVELKPKLKKADTISITGGKGGVGKTSIALKLASLFAEQGEKVLLIDCDYNLSNTAIKLGLPVNNALLDYYKMRKDLKDAIVTYKGFDLLSSSSGSTELFDNETGLDRFIVDVMVKCESMYDKIILDCPAGLSKDVLTLNAYSDYRFFVVTPDRSSITDSYSMMKLLATQYGVKSNHLIVNKVSTVRQFQRVVKSLSETVENFLNAHLAILGRVIRENISIDQFDQLILGGKNSQLHNDLLKITKKFSDESDGSRIKLSSDYRIVDINRQDVSQSIS